MGKFIAEQTVKMMIAAGSQVKGAKVSVLGLTFKENCPDLRNSRVIDVINELRSYGVEVHVHDPVPNAGEAKHEYGITLETWEQLPQADAIVLAVSHKEFAARPLADYQAKLTANGVLADVKAVFDPQAVKAAGIPFWRL